MGHFNSSYPPGAASEGMRRHRGLNPDAFKMAPKGFRSLGRGEHAGHMGRTTINPHAPMTNHPAHVVRRVHSLFGKAILD